MKTRVINYIQLTKPTIMFLVLFTGATAAFLEGSLIHEPIRLLLFLVGLYLTGGSANALNQYFERDIDANMERTKKRRPLPTGQLKPLEALLFSITIGLAGTLLLALIFNWLTALLSLSTILFYGLFYTLWLKPRTEYNIVIGGVAGAIGPIGAWAAATGTVTLEPWLLFLIIFAWTPPHFWALALYCKDDYRRTGLPMMPVVRGDDATLKQIWQYALVMVLISLTPVIFEAGLIYLSLTLLLGLSFLQKVRMARKQKDIKSFRSLFFYSIIYLFAVFGALMLDKVIQSLSGWSWLAI